MNRWLAMAAAGWAMGAAAAAPVWAQAVKPTPPAGPPDVLVLVYQQPGQGDLINVTYARVVPHPQAQRDLTALAQATGWPVGQAAISDGLPPVQNKIGQMTSSVVTVPNVVPWDARAFPLQPFIQAFRAYKRLNLVFSVAPGFRFQGLRDYADKNVTLSLQQKDNVFTYQVQVLNPALDGFQLPQQQAQSGQTAEAPRRGVSRWALFSALAVLALAAGVLVYALMARKPPAIPPANAQSEEQPTLGTKG